jgi:hypothetical protein
LEDPKRVAMAALIMAIHVVRRGDGWNSVWIVSSGDICAGCLEHPVYVKQYLLSHLHLQPIVITGEGSE